jgi:hypothetical protein
MGVYIANSSKQAACLPERRTMIVEKINEVKEMVKSRYGKFAETGGGEAG